MVDQSNWIILNRVLVQEAFEWLIDRHNGEYPDHPFWKGSVPKLNPIVKPDILTVEGYRVEADGNGLVTVYRLNSDEILAQNITPDQLTRIMTGEDTID